MEPVVGVGKVEILDESECRALLARQPVGRIAYVTDTGKPMIVPVDFMVVDDLVVFRTDPGDKLLHAPMRQVCFEADGGEAVERVWSVVVHGLARDVTTALDERYERKTSTKSEPYFNLKAANGQVIGHSEMYSSTSAMENGIASVKKNAPTATVVDRTV